MNFGSTYITNLLIILTAWSLAFLGALWLSLIFWTYRDIRGRSRDPLARILAVLVVALLFLPGIAIYLILRPHRTIEEEYLQSLEEEALLQSIENSALCPGCGRRVKDDWIICPSCNTKLKKKCQSCGKLMELPWNICPYCGTPVPGLRRDDLTLDEVITPIESADELDELDELGFESKNDVESKFPLNLEDDEMDKVDIPIIPDENPEDNNSEQ